MTWAVGLALMTALGRPVPAVLLTDCGAEADDQWALAHLALSPAVGLRGVVTSHAPSLKKPAAPTAAGATVSSRAIRAQGRPSQAKTARTPATAHQTPSTAAISVTPVTSSERVSPLT